jgi:ubiquinone/menaquinone biosynthesis C-methylase UbiE|tara:strand:+ start:416 stop:1393 length:978 start_codon:yes stop_codon:yes gene_type:complete
MKNIVNIDDFYDLYYKIQQQGLNVITNRLGISQKSRVKRVWDKNSNPSINWWSVPKIVERWNKLISHNYNIKYQDYFVDKYLKNEKKLILLSPGCGNAIKEMEYAKYSQFKLVECVDMSSERVKIAQENSREKSFDNMIFSVNDLATFEFKKNHYDIIVFDMILHHIKNVGNILEKVKYSLKNDGLLLINEYVGPNRFQYTKEQLDESNQILKKIPKKFKKRWNSKIIKTKIYKPGILRMILADPSEAINSESIIPTLNNMFDLVEEKPYGGNLLHLILKDISHHFIDNHSETTELLNYLFEQEDKFIKKYKVSDFIFCIYKNNN